MITEKAVQLYCDGYLVAVAKSNPFAVNPRYDPLPSDIAWEAQR